MAEHEHTQTAAAEADSKWAAIVARLDDVSPESREAAGEAVMDAYLLGLERGAARAAAAASGSSPRAQAPAVEGAVSVIDPVVTVPVERPVDLHFGLRPAGDDRVRLADLDMAARHSSVIGVSSRFARAAAGQEGDVDWVRFRTGSGPQYEGYRSEACPGDGVPGHRHDIRCIDGRRGQRDQEPSR